MNEVSSHGVQKVRVLVNYVLVVEKELVWLEQLLLFHHELVGLLVILHYLVVFHVVVGNSLSTEHYQCVLVNHVQAYQPDSSVKNGVENSPGVSLHVQLLYRRAVASGFVANGVDVPASKGAAVRASDGLLQGW